MMYEARRPGSRERAVNFIVKEAAEPSGVNPAASIHWLRHAHASHAIDNGAPIMLVSATLGHADLKTTSVYAHARPGESSGRVFENKVLSCQRAQEPGSTATQQFRQLYEGLLPCLIASPHACSSTGIKSP